MPAIKNDRIKQVVKDNSNKLSYFLKYTMGKKEKVTFNLMVKYNETEREYYTFAKFHQYQNKKTASYAVFFVIIFLLINT
jgi:hypothetical protein